MAKHATRRKKSARLTSHHNAAKNSDLTLWVLVGIILGVLITFGFLHWQKQQKNLSGHPAKKTAAGQSHKQIEFDFYQILPSIKPKSLTSGNPKPASTSNASNTTNHADNVEKLPEPSTANKTGKETFNLQIGPVKDYAEIDRMRAEMALMGYNVTIQTTKFNNQLIYRLILGPYVKLDSAKATQKNLQKNHISSVIIRSN